MSKKGGTPRSSSNKQREGGATDTSAKNKASAETPTAKQGGDEGLRETIESIVVAFILAFLFRAFEAEAFVIPTGSMAPTLYGRHKELHCDQCNWLFAVGASDEIDKDSGYYNPNNRLRSAFCPNCRYENPITDKRVFKGDRILVNKFPYEIGSPHRWDVAVFKYPENPQTNYIKRLVGLPGEELQIKRGDVYVRRQPDAEFQILRKDDPDKQRVLQQLVYSQNNVPAYLQEFGWPERWQPLAPDPQQHLQWTSDSKGWQHDADTHEFSLSDQDAPDDWRWIRYRHLVPTTDDFLAAQSGDRGVKPRPQLITDYCSYNGYTGGDPRMINIQDDVYWVGDLTVECTLAVAKTQGTVLFELVEGVRRYRCEIDLASGDASLYFLDDQLSLDHPENVPLATARTAINQAGRYEIAFANVDQRLCLWVNDDLVKFDGNGEYSAPAFPGPQQDDLQPVGIAGKNAEIAVSDLIVYRDVYYRAERTDDDGFGHDQEFQRSTHYLAALVNDPLAWNREYESHHQAAVFAPLAADEYFMLGDNSPRSQDSRLWPNERGAVHRHAVKENALVGKAFFLYWPHGVPFGNDGKGYSISIWPLSGFFYHFSSPGRLAEPLYPKFSIPFYPYVSRMKRIR